jgi:hypothetical protein
MASTLRERLFRRVIKLPEWLGGHWIWTGAVNGDSGDSGTQGGYGVIREGRKFFKVHRLTLAWATGNEGIGLDAAHDNACPRRCCNPAHLAWKTHHENLKDVILKHGRLGKGTTESRRALPLFTEPTP